MYFYDDANSKKSAEVGTRAAAELIIVQKAKPSVWVN